MKNKMLCLLAIMLVAACQREEICQTRRYSAVTEGFETTRTSLNEDNEVLWSKDDMIAIFENNDKPSKYQITSSSAGQASAEFSLVTPAQKGTSIGADVAVYPYDESLAVSRMSTGMYRLKELTVPAVQEYAAASFGPGAFPMIAISETGSGRLAFKNICGVLRLNLTGSEAVRSITVKGNDGELLSGPFVLNMDPAGLPSVTAATGAAAEVKLDCGPEGVMLSQTKATPFLIVLPPTAFTSGFTVNIIDVNGGEMELSTSKANPVKRSSILKMPEKTFTPKTPDTPSVTSIETVSLSFDEVIIKVTVCNAVQYSGGFKLKSEFNLDQIKREANWKIVPRITDSFVYEGPLTAFPAGGDAAAVSSGQTYVVWVAPYAKGQTMVSTDDIIYKEITVPDITSGGSRKVSVSSFNAAFKSVTANVSSSGASTIYAAFATSSELSSLSSDEAKINWLKANASPISGESGEVSRSGLASGTSLTLLAIAVDESGRYGSILKYSCSTRVPAFNESISIVLSETYKEKTANIKVTATGAEISRFYYFADQASSSSWTRVLGGTREAAEEYMAVNSDNYLISNTDETPLTGGCIVMDDLMMGEKYVVVVMAEDVNGNFSRAHMLTFMPELDLGSFVYSTGSTRTKWIASKPKVTFGNCEQDEEFYVVNWTVTPATGMTAYTICAHPNMMEDCTEPEDLAVRIFNKGVQVVPGKTETLLYGDKSNLVYVTWKDAAGNFYEPVLFAVP